MTLAASPLLRTLLMALALGATSCKTEQPADTGAAGVVKMKLGRETFALEVADTPRKQQLGLMHRKSMPQDRGMLFVFPDEQERNFWMKNTLIPLDMIWMDADHRIVHIAHDVAPCKADPCPNYPPNAKASSVLELAAGVAAKHHLKDGDVLRFEGMNSVVVR